MGRLAKKKNRVEWKKQKWRMFSTGGFIDHKQILSEFELKYYKNNKNILKDSEEAKRVLERLAMLNLAGNPKITGLFKRYASIILNAYEKQNSQALYYIINELKDIHHTGFPEEVAQLKLAALSLYEKLRKDALGLSPRKRKSK